MLASGLGLSALLALVSVVLFSTMTAEMGQTTFVRSDLLNHNSTRIGDPWQTLSVLSCVRDCMDVYSSSCYSVTYNTKTGLCTPGSMISYNSHGGIRAAEDLFYYTNTCNEEIGLHLYVYKTVTQCLFVSTYTANFTWARQICTYKGAILYIIDSQEKFDLLKLIIKTVNKKPTWVGLTDQVTEGTFVWENGQPAKGGPFPVPWRPGEPNNKNNNEDCCEIGLAEDFDHINDNDCPLNRLFICQI